MVDQFNYLGRILANNSRYKKEIKVRKAVATIALCKRKKLITDRIHVSLSKRLLKNYNWSVVHYMEQPWAMYGGKLSGKL